MLIKKESRFKHALKSFWSFGQAQNSPEEFEHVHLPDEGQEFLKPTLKMFMVELGNIPEADHEVAITHFKSAEEQFKNCQYRDAATNFQKAYESSKSLSALLAQSIALIMISELYSAKEKFEEGYKHSQDQQTLLFEVAFGIGLGLVYNDLGSLLDAKKLFEKICKICRTNDNYKIESLSHRHLALVMKDAGDYENAIEQGKQTLVISSQEKDDIEQAAGLCTIGIVNQTFGYLNKAEESFRAGLNLIEKLGYNYHLGRLWAGLSSVLLLKGNVADAKKAQEISLNIHRRLAYKHGEIRNLESLAGLQYIENGASGGCEIFNNFIKQNAQIAYKKGEIRSRLNLGKIYLDANESAELMFKSCLKMAQTTGLCRATIEAASNLALIIKSPNLIEQLENLTQETRVKNLRLQEIQITLLLGIAHLQTNQIVRAEELFLETLAICRHTRFQQMEAITLRHLAYIYESQNKTNQAAETIAIAQSLLKNSGFPLNQNSL